MMEPEHRNSIALKKAWVQICRKASCGWLSPIVTIISPNWLDVENATIFLMSFCVSAQVAVNRVVRAPRHRQMVRISWLFSIRGCSRISRKMPATTIVLECSRADTGVGPSIADGSHGCSPNWADFPVAASTRPSSGSVMLKSFDSMKICGISQELRFIAIQAMARINPTSPTRL